MIQIKTFQDLLDLGDNEKERMEFVLKAIAEHKQSDAYKVARDAELYYQHQNPTIMRFQRFVYDRFGRKVPDVWSPNNKIASNWYNYFTDQSVQYLLGNGVSFKGKDTHDKLGKKIDHQLQEIATTAKNGGVGFGFWNLDHLDVFKLTEFVPLWDEEDGSLKAGIRWWQISDEKPLRATLYELDGYTQYIRRKDEDVRVFAEKKQYIQISRVSEASGEEILDGENYSGFPIVPMWNVSKQSDLVGNRGTIDAYDLMVSGLINNVSEGEFLYWILTNCDGMSNDEVNQFIEQLKLNHVAKADGGTDGSRVESHQVTVPFEASAEAIKQLESQLFRDFMALRVDDIAAGATNDQIQAAYEPLNQKTDKFEYQVTDFIQRILALAGIEDEPTYTRSQMSNRAETAEIIMADTDLLSRQYKTKKLLTLLGDIDSVEEVEKELLEEEASRFQNEPNEGDE